MLPSRVLIAAQIKARAGSKCGIIEGAETGYASAQADDVVSFPIASLSERARSQQPVTSPKGGFLLPISIGPRQNEIGRCVECGGIIDGPCVELGIPARRSGLSVYVLLHRRCAGDIASDMKKISEQ